MGVFDDANGCVRNYIQHDTGKCDPFLWALNYFYWPVA